jgi:hypothetical protein
MPGLGLGPRGKKGEKREARGEEGREGVGWAKSLGCFFLLFFSFPLIQTQSIHTNPFEFNQI